MTIQGKIGNKTYEVRNIPIAELEKLKVFEDVQRKLDKTHGKKIERYMLDGLSGVNENIFFAPLVASLRPDGTLSVNDGQHRLYGMVSLLNTLTDRVMKLRTKMSKKKDITEEQMKELQKEKEIADYALVVLRGWTIPVMIYRDLSPSEERQLFHDLNNTAKKPPVSVSLQYDTSNLLTRIAKESVESVKGFDGEVEWGNKNSGKSLFIFSNIHNSVVKFLGKKKNEAVTEDNYDEKLEIAKRFFQIFFDTLPVDPKDPQYIYQLAPTLQGIASFAYQLRGIEKVSWENTLREALANFQMTHTNPLFMSIGGLTVSESGQLVFRGSGGAVNAVAKTLMGSSRLLDADGKQVFVAPVDNGDNGDEELSLSDTQIDESVIQDKVLEEDNKENQPAITLDSDPEPELKDDLSIDLRLDELETASAKESDQDEKNDGGEDVSKILENFVLE